jgi:hypothetical protein
VPVLKIERGGVSGRTEKQQGSFGSNTNHEAFNLKSIFIAGYAHNILRGIKCGGSCAVNQVVPATNEPVWLCPILNSSGQAEYKFALCKSVLWDCKVEQRFIVEKAETEKSQLISLIIHYTI